MKLLIAGGGTGGHLFPGLAVADLLKKRDKKASILFVGTERGIESRVLPERGYDLKTINISGFFGKNVFEKIFLIPMVIGAILESIAILKEFKPEVVLGVGGYASGPVLLAAKMLRMSTIIHEQNAAPGLTNRLLSKIVDKVAVTFGNSIASFPAEKVIITGNPVRMELFAVPAAERTKNILVFGGSRGAQAINSAMIKALPYLEELKGKVTITHQCGDDDYDRMWVGYESAQWREYVTVIPFIEQMADAYAKAQLVICRAGATTLSELAAVKRGSVLIPYPYASEDHQTVNARELADSGSAILLPQDELSGKRLATIILELFAYEERIEMMADAVAAFARPVATMLLLDECLNMAGKGE